mmetsp:Transcript_17559/g.34296  ORF Transcript_17559/g.34296 Transcript_17559/m.34296 type:complete len:493 (-) Transcript_17559:238-1716(-)|eukprot:CAMPEP_0175141008 /NCGR_PEP_ID=MMETSP0087-20121206/11840_1 /TAXON_ID=136419 /ORGANISM="Unknown Unknown, Strain D1" /LENGTH=492 /DNA_ID=CAMNT_0016424323 /DNA_START=39 /DNA_END=1517 /DNA_ORIENTATION=+
MSAEEGLVFEGPQPEEKKVDVEKAEAFKTEGNDYFKKNLFARAIIAYSQAIDINPKNAIYFSNRAFCHIKMENFGLAIEDATNGIKADKTYIKSYYRRGAAQLGLARYKEALKNFQQVLKIKPKDADAKKKAAECQKAIHAAAFLKAIESEDAKPVSETTDWKDVAVESSYTGPHYSEDMDRPNESFLRELMGHFKAQKRLHTKYVYRILIEIIKLLSKLPTVVDIAVPEGQHITVCGDVHGQFYDVLNIFEMNGIPSETNPYLFNGDFVDRGSFSLEIILLFFSFKLAYPNHFHMMRGNHESLNMNQIYGFKGEVVAKSTGLGFDLFTEAFNWLPLGAVIGEKVLVVHGGLFSEDGVKLDDMRKIDRNRQPPEKGLMCEMLWSDPQPMKGRAPSKRGVGLAFGPDVTHRFLDDNGLDLIIRSHEVKMEGFEVEAEGRLITVFSAPNYCDSMGNKGAFIRLEHDLKPKMTSFTASPHPPIQPMAYASPMYRM